MGLRGHSTFGCCVPKVHYAGVSASPDLEKVIQHKPKGDLSSKVFNYPTALKFLNRKIRLLATFSLEFEVNLHYHGSLPFIDSQKVK